MLLNNRARDLLDNYTAGLAQHFGTQNPGRYFSLNDPQETALRLAMLESVEFLNWITTLDVDQLSGQVVNVGASVLHEDFNKALARQLQAIGFGWDVNAQDIRGRT